MPHLSMDGFHVMDHGSWVDPVGSTPWVLTVHPTCIHYMCRYTIYNPYTWLVVSNMAGLFSIYIWDVILPIDELIFVRGVAQPPTQKL